MIWQLGCNIPERRMKLFDPSPCWEKHLALVCLGRNQADLQSAPAFPAAIFIPWISALGKGENHNLALNLLQASYCRDSASMNCKALKEVGIKTRNKEDVDMFYYWI